MTSLLKKKKHAKNSWQFGRTMSNNGPSKRSWAIRGQSTTIVPVRIIILPTGRNCGFRDVPQGICYVARMTMQLEFTPAILEELNYERFHHPIPMVQRRMEA